MSTSRSYPRVAGLVAELCETDAAKVRAESRLVGFGMDSVRILDLLMELEEEYDIEISDSDPDLASVETVEDLARLIDRRRGVASD
jgi:acyl carrier protein